MKKSIRILALVLALCLMGTLCACSSGSKSSSTTPTSNTPAGSTTPSNSAEPTKSGATATPASSGSNLATAKSGTSGKGDGDDKVLTMGTNAEFPPYEYHDGDKIVGIDAEIAKAIADKLGMTLKIEDMAFDSIITAVQSGKIDMGMAGMTVTDERLKSVNFSKSYATGVQVVIVKDGSPIKTVDDLFGTNNYTVGVQTATTGDIYTTSDFEEKKLGTVQRYNKGADAVAALVSGKIDCVVIDNEPAKAFVTANKGLKILDTQYTVEDYAICMAKDNTDLLNKVNSALDSLIADGTVKSIIDKYIGK